MLTKIILNSVLMLSVLTVVLTPWILKARERKRIHEILSRSIDKGVAPPPEVLKALADNAEPKTEPRSQPQRDLRAGVIWLSVALGIGTLAYGLIVGHDPKYFYLPIKEPIAALGLAGLPASIGIGYLILGFAGRKTID